MLKTEGEGKREARNSKIEKIDFPQEISTEGRLMHVHPIWIKFIKYCETIDCGEIDKLKIQDGLPMLIEEIKKKVTFSDGE
jgi:hypothetical protein